MTYVSRNCWANNDRGAVDPWGVVMACNVQPEDDDLGLCPKHRQEIILFRPREIVGL